MKSAIEQLRLVAKELGDSCRKCCSMVNNCCCYFVSKGFKKSDNGSLFYNGVTVTYCPNAIKWCKTHMAQIPMYLAMPSDVIFFDWNHNNVPDHIGFVREHKSCDEIYTLEGNTNNGVVAYKTRPSKYVLGIYRPHFPTKYDISKPIAEDGDYAYSSIALTQKWLGVPVDGILGLGTVKAIQKKVGVTQDGSWGTATSKALQKLIGVKQDGYFGEGSVKAFQKYLNKAVFKDAKPTPTPTPKPTPQPTPKPTDKLVVDGVFGTASIKKAQQYFGTPVDGVIGGQLKKLATKYPGINADCITWGGGGSTFIKAMQKKFGLIEDGIIGTTTIKALQQYLKVKADGVWGKATSRAFQLFLNDPSSYKTGKVTVEDPLEDRIMQACIEQSVWMKNAKYGWIGKPTIANSKDEGTCVSFVAVVLQRLKYLASGKFIWHTGRGYGDGKVYGTNNRMTVTYMGNKTLRACRNQLKKGDIIMMDDNKSGKKGGGGHIAIVTGAWKNGNPYIWDNETAKKGRKSRLYSGSRKLLARVRLKGE